MRAASELTALARHIQQRSQAPGDARDAWLASTIAHYRMTYAQLGKLYHAAYAEAQRHIGV